MNLQLVRIEENLPDGFETLRIEAEGEGWRHMTRLAQEWATGLQRFDAPGEALLAAYVEGDLAAVGGIAVEPTETIEPAMRLRRLYVRRLARRRGVGATLVSALLQGALTHTSLITVHAGREDAGAFWVSQGFTAVEGRAWSHIWRPA